MKIRNLVLGMMACAAFTACTNEEIIDNAGNKLEGDAYVSIDIFTPSGTSTRAISDASFEDGTTEENTVTKATFLFFDVAGNSCAIVEKEDLEWKNGSDGIEKISVPVLVLNPITGTIPTSVITVLNPGNLNFAGKTLAQVKALIGKSEAYKAGFMMSNSVYALNNSTVAEVALTPMNVAASEADAKANPVKVPVERVVAKVSVSGLDITSGEQTINVDGKEITVKAVITGWKVTATNPDSYLVKSIDPTWSFSWTNVGSWNNPANFRSYWAISATPEKYTYYSYTDADNNTATHEYCLENAGDAAGNSVATNTLLWAVAQLQDSENNPVDFMQWRGTKYSVDGVKTLMTKMLNKYYYKKSDNTYGTIEKEHLEFKPGVEQYQVVASLVKGVAFYNMNSDGTINTTDKTAELIADIEAFAPVLYWKNGMTYYYTTINHDMNGTANVPGIVRNHVYKMAINSIAGLGTPIPNGNEIIIPTKPEDDKDSYLAAQVQVLKWKVVSQIVDFN